MLHYDPYGTRTRVTAVKGRCLNRLTNGPFYKIMGLNGLEPSTSRLSGVRSNQLSYRPQIRKKRVTRIELATTAWKAVVLPLNYTRMAVWTGLEPATSCVTGRHSNQLNYQTILFFLCAFEIKSNCGGRI